MSTKAGYIPLVGSLIHSTIWREPDHVRLLWITMLCMADADGYVAASLPGMADAARISVEHCRDALRVLMSPDPDSRDKADGGQRVFEAEGGWSIPAVPRYRQKVSTNAARCARYQQNRRALTRIDARKDTTDTDTETETETEKEKRREEGLTPRRRFTAPSAQEVSDYGKSIGFNLDGQGFVDFYAAKGWVVGKSPMKDWKAAVRTWKQRRVVETNGKPEEIPFDAEACEKRLREKGLI